MTNVHEADGKTRSSGGVSWLGFFESVGVVFELDFPLDYGFATVRAPWQRGQRLCSTGPIAQLELASGIEDAHHSSNNRLWP